MTNTNIANDFSQLKMPGLDQLNTTKQSPSCCTLEPGVHVQYIGKINGGPKYGSNGIVKKALHQKAVVDMGLMGTWHVPYYFLGVGSAA
tara:strand:- start:3806 stop:4072 length:267 start_codon:yes stop_codon:yes gene_type:complete